LPNFSRNIGISVALRLLELCYGSYEEKIVDEGMPNRPSIFAYLVFGRGGTSAEGISRPITLIAWRGPGAKLAVQGEDSKEEA
jgi:hypothetical protein